MALNTRWFEPLSDNEDDNLASWVALQFDVCIKYLVLN